MKNKHLLLTAIATAAAFSLHAAEIGTAFTYQGRLTDGGVPANGNYDIQFDLRDAPAGGNSVGASNSVTSVATSNGLFTVTLDFGANPFAGSARWLEISVRANNNGTNANGNFNTLTPRQPLTPTPYALYTPSAGVASVANSVSASTIIQGQSLLVGVGNSLAGSYATISGGGSNSANGSYAAVLGGFGNTAVSNSAAIGGGSRNIASGNHALVAGGEGNSAIGDHAFVGGGANNTARGYDVVCGGMSNSVGADWSVLGGGLNNAINLSTSWHSVLAGGHMNHLEGNGAFSGGGLINTNLATASTLVGGFANRISAGANYGVLGGGRSGRVGAIYGVLAGGDANAVDGARGFIGGGELNTVSAGASYGVIGGGRSGQVGGIYGVLGGGDDNAVDGPRGFIGGGELNAIEANGVHNVIGGGRNNLIGNAGGISANASAVGGGAENVIHGAAVATVAGGGGNHIESSADYASIGGGGFNGVWANSATIGGGYGNVVHANRATIGGGYYNEVGFVGFTSIGDSGVIGGGNNNKVRNSYATVAGGSQNTIDQSAEYAAIPGGLSAHAFNYGQHVFASGSTTTRGDAQSSLYVLRGNSTGSSTTELFLDGPNASKRITVPVGSVWTLRIHVAAVYAYSLPPQQRSGFAAYEASGVVANLPALINGGPAHRLIELHMVDGSGNPITTARPIFESATGGDSTASWQATPYVDTTDNTLRIAVNGAVDGFGVIGFNVKWTATIQTTEVLIP